MSYGAAAALQAAIYDRLASHAGLTALIGAAVFDAAPAGALPDTYVTLGPEDVRDASDAGSAGAQHRFTISVVSRSAGFAAAKAAAAAVGDALLDGPGLTLERGRVVGLWFERARARRSGSGGSLRQIDLRFRARVEDIPVT